MFLLTKYTRLLATYFRPQRGRVALLALLLFGSIGLQLLNPQLIRYVLDTAEGGGTLAVLTLAAALFILFGLLQAGANFAATYVGEDVSWTATNALRADLAHHALRLPMSFHNSHTPGELIERIDGDVSQLAAFFSQLVLNVVANGLLVLGVIVLLTIEDWRLGIAAFAYALLVMLALQAVQTRTVRLWSAARGTSAALYGFIEERMVGREDIRANGGVPYVIRRLLQLQGAVYRAHYHARVFGIFTYGLTHLLAVAARLLALGLGIWLFFQGQVTIGALFLIVYYVSLLQDPLEKLRTEIEALQQATASIDRINALLAETPQLGPTATAVTEPAIDPTTGGMAVTFDRVSFRYADPPSAQARPSTGESVETQNSTGSILSGPSVLQEISFYLPAGQILGLLGRTGSGKTTLTRLLFQLYQPQQGAIDLGDTPLATIDSAVLRRHIGMVTQEVQLFQASLRDNLTFFDPTVEDAQIIDAIETLGLGRWFTAQSHGLDSVLTGGGSGLSAGEAQLLAFVRVFLKQPELVILDEASSRLDPATEQLLEKAIDRLLVNRTGIIIAHRLATVQRADKILILENGRIAEFGDRIALAANADSRFAHLLQHGLQEVLA